MIFLAIILISDGCYARGTPTVSAYKYVYVDADKTNADMVVPDKVVCWQNAVVSAGVFFIVE